MDVRTDGGERRSELASVRGRNGLLAGALAAAILCLGGCEPLLRLVPLDVASPSSEEPTPLSAVAFSDLPEWANTDLAASLDAFRKSCAVISNLAADAPFSRRAPYGGLVGDWLEPCAAAGELSDPRVFFETYFTPFEIAPDAASSKLTGYFEPEIDARPAPEQGYEAAIPGPPADLITIELGQFDPALAPRKLWGKVEDGRFGLYPARADIVDDPSRALAFADPGDVFYLQIQGSGRVSLPDGHVFRAAFAAHNSRPFGSIARHLIREGEIDASEAGLSGVKAWMKRAGPVAAQDAMNVNPRYVWFQAEPLTDPNEGPRGAQGVALTPMASMAVDPDHHPYGAPMFIDTRVPRVGGDWRGDPHQTLIVAQDTGGAIVGVRRGDLFFGWGDEAGARAASMNHELRMWVLLPTSLAERMAATAGPGSVE